MGTTSGGGGQSSKQVPLAGEDTGGVKEEEAVMEVVV